MINFNRLQSGIASSSSSSRPRSGLASKVNGSNLSQNQRQNFKKTNNLQNNSNSKFDFSNYQYGSNTKVLVNHDGSTINFEKGSLNKNLASKIQPQQKGHNYQLRSLEIQRQAAKGQWQKGNIEQRISKFSSRMYKKDFDLGKMDRDLTKNNFENSNNINKEENKNAK